MRENKGRRWSEADIETLIRLSSDGVESADIADVIGRTQISVKQRIHLIEQSSRTEFQCVRCRMAKPSDEFVSTMRCDGGYCHPCRTSGWSRPVGLNSILRVVVAAVPPEQPSDLILGNGFGLRAGGFLRCLTRKRSACVRRRERV